MFSLARRLANISLVVELGKSSYRLSCLAKIKKKGRISLGIYAMQKEFDFVSFKIHILNNNYVSYIALNPIWVIAQSAPQYNIKISIKRFDKHVCFQPVFEYIIIIWCLGGLREFVPQLWGAHWECSVTESLIRGGDRKQRKKAWKDLKNRVPWVVHKVLYCFYSTTAPTAASHVTTAAATATTGSSSPTTGRPTTNQPTTPSSAPQSTTGNHWWIYVARPLSEWYHTIVSSDSLLP